MTTRAVLVAGALLATAACSVSVSSETNFPEGCIRGHTEVIDGGPPVAICDEWRPPAPAPQEGP